MGEAAFCPICGYEFPIWVDEIPIKSCPHTGRMDLCTDARGRAHGEAMRRRVCPDAFGADGRILPGQLGRVVQAMHTAGLNAFSGRPLIARKAGHA